METTGESVSAQPERGSLGRYHLSGNFKEVKEPTRRRAGRAAEAEGCEDRFQAGEPVRVEETEIGRYDNKTAAAGTEGQVSQEEETEAR